MISFLTTCKSLRHSTHLVNNLTLNVRCLSLHSVQCARLAEVGKLSALKLHEQYETGQFFLYRVFGYRGVVLFPWRAKVYDRNPCTTTDENVAAGLDLDSGPVKPLTKTDAKSDADKSAKNVETTIDDTNSDTINGRSDNKKEVTLKAKSYYQVLVDSRDCPHVRAQTEGVTILNHQKNSNRNLYAIPGLDYVSHDDILPYTVWNRDRHPLRHELFSKFLIHTGKNNISFKPSELLYAWQERNHPWLELSEVHRETTENIRVTVIPFYMGSKQTQRTPVHWWRYCVRLENLGKLSVQLRERHWRIFALSGTLETVRGRGVIGQEPILNSMAPAFQYSSHINLHAPSGHMWGTFLMEREDGYSFDCRIPPFSLDSVSNSEILDE